jgi:hypothetical protein
MAFGGAYLEDRAMIWVEGVMPVAEEQDGEG